MATSNRADPVPTDATSDWRDAWSSEADITTCVPPRSAALHGISALSPDVLASALDEFLPELPPAPTPEATAPPAAVRAQPALPQRQPRGIVVAAAAVAVLLLALAIGSRGSRAPAARDVLIPPVLPAPPAAAVAHDAHLVAARSAQDERADLRVGKAQGSARAAAPSRGAWTPPSGPSATPAARRTPLAGIAAQVAPFVELAASAAESDPGAHRSAPPPSAPPSDASPPPTVGPATSATLAPPTDRQAIHAVLGNYQAAFSRLDAAAVRAIWPDLNAVALERAFGQVERQTVTFSACSVAIIGAGATARCQGSASYVPKVGSRTERVDNRYWQIDLRKTGDSWRIVTVDSRD